MTSLRQADGVRVEVLVDNTIDPASTTPMFVTAEWDVMRQRGMTKLHGSCQCCGSHGLSLLITARFGGESRSVLFDAGPSDGVFEFNVERLRTDLAGVEAVVLSHGHWDHAGGLVKAIQSIHQAGTRLRRIPCFLHPGMFVERGVPRPLGGVLPVQAIPSPTELAAAGADPIVTTDPQFLLDNAFYLSGEIPRQTTFERGFRGHVRRNAVGDWEPDPLILDERYLAVKLRGKGLLVFSACSHAGIVNVLLDSKACFADEAIFGAMGGLHLTGSGEQAIGQTVDAMAGLDLQLVAPGHCTGWRAVAALSTRLRPDQLVPIAVGQVYEL